MGPDKALVRLLRKADQSGGADTCWPFLGARKPTGYGNFWLFGETVGAHVAAYRLMVGDIPDGLEIDHRCHDAEACAGGVSCFHRRCVNPAHLRAVTHRVNDLRGVSFSAVNAAKTECPAGHKYDDENTYRAPGSPQDRHCRKCSANRRSR